MDNKTEEERRKDNCEKHRHWRENLDSERLESYREYHRQYESKQNREVINRKKLNYYNTRLLKAVKYLGGKCQVCGLVDDPVVYDFHHLRDKEFYKHWVVELPVGDHTTGIGQMPVVMCSLSPEDSRWSD